MRTIADDLQGLSAQAWATTAYLITSTIVTPLYGKLVRHLRPQAVLHHRHLDLHRRLGAVHLRDLDRHPGACTAPCRASAPVACSRWRWRSSATSCRRVSAPSTRATSSPCSAPPACSARSSAASSPARRPSSASPAGAGSSSSTCRSASPPSSSSREPCTCTTSACDHRIDCWGAVQPSPSAWSRCSSSPSRAASGAGTSASAAALLRHRRPRARRPSSGIEWRMGEEALAPVAAVPHPHRRRVLDRLGAHRHGHVRRHRRAAPVPADRQGRDADPGRPAAPAADPRASCSARSCPAS